MSDAAPAPASAPSATPAVASGASPAPGVIPKAAPTVSHRNINSKLKRASVVAPAATPAAAGTISHHNLNAKLSYLRSIPANVKYVKQQHSKSPGKGHHRKHGKHQQLVRKSDHHAVVPVPYTVSGTTSTIHGNRRSRRHGRQKLIGPQVAGPVFAGSGTKNEPDQQQNVERQRRRPAWRKRIYGPQEQEHYIVSKGSRKKRKHNQRNNQQLNVPLRLSDPLLSAPVPNLYSGTSTINEQDFRQQNKPMRKHIIHARRGYPSVVQGTRRERKHHHHSYSQNRPVLRQFEGAADKDSSIARGYQQYPSDDTRVVNRASTMKKHAERTLQPPKVEGYKFYPATLPPNRRLKKPSSRTNEIIDAPPPLPPQPVNTPPNRRLKKPPVRTNEITDAPPPFPPQSVNTPIDSDYNAPLSSDDTAGQSVPYTGAAENTVYLQPYEQQYADVRRNRYFGPLQYRDTRENADGYSDTRQYSDAQQKAVYFGPHEQQYYTVQGNNVPYPGPIEQRPQPVNHFVHHEYSANYPPDSRRKRHEHHRKRTTDQITQHLDFREEKPSIRDIVHKRYNL